MTDRFAEFRQFQASHPLQACTIDGALWEYLVGGTGATPLVLLPGGFGSAATAFRYVLALEDTCRVLAVSYPDTLASADALADGLAALLRREGVAGAHLLGGSYSGVVAQCFARRHRSLVRTLILSHTGAPRPRRAYLAETFRLLFRMLPLPLLRRVFRLANHAFLPGGGAEQRFWRAHFGHMIDTLPHYAYTNRLHVLRDFDRNHHFAPADLLPDPPPVLLLEAARDRFIGGSERTALRRLYPHARCHTFPAGLHADTVTQPEAEIAILAGWVAEYGA